MRSAALNMKAAAQIGPLHGGAMEIPSNSNSRENLYIVSARPATDANWMPLGVAANRVIAQAALEAEFPILALHVGFTEVTK